MATGRARIDGVERHKIVRGAFRDLGRVIAVVIAAMVAWAGLFVVAASAGAEMSRWGIGLPIGFLAVMAAMFVWINLPGSVTIGADGILVDWRGEVRYVPFAAVSGASLYLEKKGGKKIVGVFIELVSQERLRVAMGEDQFGAKDQAEKLCRGITRALERHRAAATPEEEDRLARRTLGGEAWLAKLRSMGAGANAGHREAPLPPDRLWRIVEDPTASAPSRAAAAVALGPSIDAEGKARLSAIASRTVSPKLRVALQTAPSEDDAALIEALAGVEAEDATSAARHLK